MSAVMEEEIKRWTARRKSALVLEIIQGKTTVSEASRQFDLPPSEIESWVDDGKRGMENALRAKPEDVREQYERQLKDLQEAYGEAMLELRARKKLGSFEIRVGYATCGLRREKSSLPAIRKMTVRMVSSRV